MRPFNKKEKYEAIIDILDDFYAAFKDQGYLDQNCLDEYKMLIQIYDSCKKKIEQKSEETDEEELVAMTKLVDRIEEIKFTADRLLAMKCFW